MATFNKFNAFAEAVCEGVHNFQSHTFKVILTNTAPTAANSVKTDITEITAGNGYTAGGQTLTITSSSQTGGTYTAAVNQTLTWTATGGSIATLRYAVLYNDTAASKNLVGYWDYGSSVTPADTETFEFVMNTNLITLS